MSGWLTNGLPLVQPIYLNGVLQQQQNLTFNGVTQNGGNAPVYTQLSAGAMLPVDTEQGQGEQPQTVAATAFQIAALSAALAVNVATSTAGAATLNTKSGRVTTEALTTAAGATYSFTLTNSLITAAGPAPQVSVVDGSNTGGQLQLTSVTNAAGSSTFVFTNTGTSALNGTLVIAFHV